MIEINKKKFMDVKTFRKNDGFDGIQRVAGKVLEAVARRRGSGLPDDPRWFARMFVCP
jgi:hypothetical protein